MEVAKELIKFSSQGYNCSLIPPLGLRIEEMDETRDGVVNIYLTLNDSKLVE
jgi:hypothetical protein